MGRVWDVGDIGLGSGWPEGRNGGGVSLTHGSGNRCIVSDLVMRWRVLYTWGEVTSLFLPLHYNAML